jgi:two-component system sensor histidine kinase AtoS
MDWANVRDIIEEAVTLYTTSYPQIRFDLSGVSDDLSIRVDRSQLKQVLGNLVKNSIEAMNTTGHISFFADIVKTEESRYCRLQIRDDGSGIGMDHRDMIFEPYFTTKPNGTGLGLAIARHIVHDHNGMIRFESEPGAGTVFIIDFPVDS